MALVLGAVGGFVSAAEARVVSVRFQQPDATGVTAFRIYVRQAGGAYGAPAWQGLPAPSDGVYSAQVTVADTGTSYASGTAVNASGESALSNEIALAAPAPVCGNAALEPPEECDDGNTASGDGCSAGCTTERVPACGDAIVDPGEQCDDGNAAAGDGCRADCSVERCGDTRLDPAEQCDDGNTAPGDGCSATCTIERVPACGDGILDPGEACDDGNAAAGDGCRTSCTVEACGDAIRDPGEQCDDGNASAGDGCRLDCTAEACGDGRLDPGEQCDDGGTSAGDGCDAACRTEQAPACGDGVPDAGEECDDGNTTSGDGCDAQCRAEPTSSVLPLFVNVGGPDYTDPDGRTWLADAAFTDGGTPGSSSASISGTNADPMYRSRRYGTAGGPPLVFELPVGEEGLYYLRLHFAEVGSEVSSAGERVFDVQLEGSLRIEDVDVMELAGKRRALTRERTIWVSDGLLTVELLPQAGRPMLSGVELHRAEEAPAVVPSPAPPKIVGCGKHCR
ncbi:MAG: DUF4215 domain-containing protein [Deltaproteobacteria bacterium]|nr:DUF4215 domain-containing protein [Deltaproteobacteria bacterium]